MGIKYSSEKIATMIERKLSHNFGVGVEHASDDLFYKATVLVLLTVMRERRTGFRKETEEKQAKMVSIDNVEVYRKVLYLNGLDCAYCGTRVENLAKKEFNHQRIVVDYPTYRFIIETTDKALVDNLEQRVTEIAHKVDDRIVVKHDISFLSIM